MSCIFSRHRFCTAPSGLGSSAVPFPSYMGVYRLAGMRHNHELYETKGESNMSVIVTRSGVELLLVEARGHEI